MSDRVGTASNREEAIVLNDRPAAGSRVALVVSIAAAIFFVAHCLFVILGPQRRMMAWLYDDALYYAIVAMHFSTQHISSFDGITRTTGYHPLWMWLCAFVYGLRGRLDLTYLRLCMGMTTAITTVLLVLALRAAVRRKSSGWLWALALAATSYSALNNGVTIMEWPLVVMFWMALHSLLVRGFRPSQAEAAGLDWSMLVAGFLLGLGGSMSRTDFGLIPFVYLASGLVIALRYRNSRPAKTAAAALLGSVVGLGVVFSYDHRMTGDWLQQSAEVKHAFAQLASPFNPVPGLWQFARTLLYLPPMDIGPEQRTLALRLGAIAVVLVALPLCLLIYGYRKKLMRWLQRMAGESPLATFELISSAAGVVGYLGVYSLNSQATYGWYTATVTGFIVILAARVLSSVPAKVSTAIVLPLVLLNVACSFLGGTSRAQYHANETGILMRHDHPGAIMGGGDVGKASFYNKGEMINLDGLMNNEVVPYLLAGRFPCYVLDRHIAYVSNVGTITIPLTDAVRAKQKKPPVPWKKFFPTISGRNPDGDSAVYQQTNFEAIRQSGECANTH